MKGDRGIGVGATFAGVYFLFFFFFFAFYVLALRTQTRPAIEFGSGEEGLRPLFHSPFSFLSSFSSWSTDKGLGVFLWFQPLPLSPLLFGRGVRGHRHLDLFLKPLAPTVGQRRDGGTWLRPARPLSEDSCVVSSVSFNN